MASQEISLLNSTILGIVEGLTEFLPISSTGHLILCSEWLGLRDSNGAIKAFEIVIQSGALLAVAAVYLPSLLLMGRGIAGRSSEGLRLLGYLCLSFLPAAIVGLLLGHKIEDHLFSPRPVSAALAAGGIIMIFLDYRHRRRALTALDSEQEDNFQIMLNFRTALIIGLAQCLALWPGTSRSMVTIVAAMMLGFSPRSAAEYSFLLALPTLGAASAYKFLGHRADILSSSGGIGLAAGFAVSFVVAWVTVKLFLKYLNRYGLGIFGWYRLALALLVFFIWNPV